MTTAMSPRNILIAGIVLILLNVAALAPMATNAVPDAVEENFESFSKESACANDDCTEAEEDWASSTGQRDFYGYSITNVADVMANGTAPTYEKIGPVTYDITTTRTITGYDATAGELTYNSVKSFACAADTAVPCDTEVSQLNIAFQTQVIGATGFTHRRDCFSTDIVRCLGPEELGHRSLTDMRQPLVAQDSRAIGQKARRVNARCHGRNAE